MNTKKIVLLFVLAAFCCPLMAQYSDADVEAYVEKYKEYAIQAKEKYKIPASIKLAQAIYSSACGTNRLAVEGFNHFGITCRGGWEGETFYYDNINTTPDHCFRKYPSVEASYQNHSVFLSSRERYADLFKLDITDYKGWAEGLLKAGYAVNVNYPQKLINIIEKYHLDRFDRPTEEPVAEEKEPSQPVNEVVVAETTAITSAETIKEADNLKPVPVTTAVVETPAVKEEVKEPAKEEADPKPEQPKRVVETYYENDIEVIIEKEVKPTTPVKVIEQLPTPSAQIIPTTFTATKDDFRQIYYPYTNRPVYENNKTSFLIAKEGDTFANLAKEVKINENNLRAYNDVFDDTYQPIADEVVYLEPKGTKSTVTYHVMKEGESFRFVSQKYAIQLKVLLKRNGYAPAVFGVGDKICVNCK